MVIWVLLVYKQRFYVWLKLLPPVLNQLHEHHENKRYHWRILFMSSGRFIISVSLQETFPWSKLKLSQDSLEVTATFTPNHCGTPPPPPPIFKSRSLPVAPHFVGYRHLAPSRHLSTILERNSEAGGWKYDVAQYLTMAYSRLPIGSMYGIYANIWDILMVNVTIYGLHGSYGL